MSTENINTETNETKTNVTSTSNTAKSNSADDVSKLSDSDIKWRAKYKLTKEENEMLKLKLEGENKQLSEKLEALYKDRENYEKKFIDAELKAQAVAAGIKDLDFVKLIDKSELKIDESGNVVGLDKVISDFKTRKPDLFGSEKKISSSTNATFPEKATTQKTDARKMSPEEWQKNKAKFMAGHF